MNHSKGFTLAEMAVAVVILAILLFGALMPFSTQVEIRNVADTRRTMDSIKEAIIGFTQANGRLPCPALGGTPSGSAGAGLEQASCSGTFNGVIPWVTLAVPETDSWGRRFSYSVSPNFADAVGTTFGCAPVPVPTQSSFALCSVGTLTVNTRSDSTRALNAVGSVLPVVIISHGKNGFGAYTPSGATLPAPPGADETANANHAGGTTFVSRNPTTSASGCNDASAAQPYCEYDDIVAMISSSALIARAVAAGKLP